MLTTACGPVAIEIPGIEGGTLIVATQDDQGRRARIGPFDQELAEGDSFAAFVVPRDFYFRPSGPALDLASADVSMASDAPHAGSCGRCQFPGRGDTQLVFSGDRCPLSSRMLAKAGTLLDGAAQPDTQADALARELRIDWPGDCLTETDEAPPRTLEVIPLQPDHDAYPALDAARLEGGSTAIVTTKQAIWLTQDGARVGLPLEQGRQIVPLPGPDRWIAVINPTGGVWEIDRGEPRMILEQTHRSAIAAVDATTLYVAWPDGVIECALGAWTCLPQAVPAPCSSIKPTGVIFEHEQPIVLSDDGRTLRKDESGWSCGAHLPEHVRVLSWNDGAFALCSGGEGFSTDIRLYSSSSSVAATYHRPSSSAYGCNAAAWEGARRLLLFGDGAGLVFEPAPRLIPYYDGGTERPITRMHTRDARSVMVSVDGSVFLRDETQLRLVYGADDPIWGLPNLASGDAFVGFNSKSAGFGVIDTHLESWVHDGLGAEESLGPVGSDGASILGITTERNETFARTFDLDSKTWSPRTSLPRIRSPDSVVSLSSSWWLLTHDEGSLSLIDPSAELVAVEGVRAARVSASHGMAWIVTDRGALARIAVRAGSPEAEVFELATLIDDETSQIESVVGVRALGPDSARLVVKDRGEFLPFRRLLVEPSGLSCPGSSTTLTACAEGPTDAADYGVHLARGFEVGGDGSLFIQGASVGRHPFGAVLGVAVRDDAILAAGQYGRLSLIVGH
ncbi:MAG: hypothetical protein HY791_19345 [Deltaproteobacteria bacterium]|nr:hypothetical protein [Deltaproteobacteria bacterium]